MSIVRLSGLLLLLVLGQPAHGALNGALSGAWFDPAFEGAGFLVEVLPEDRAVVYWFTYDDRGGQQWYVGVGESTDETIVIAELQVARGAAFGPDFDPDQVERRSVGTLEIAFASCTAAIARFEVDGVAGEQALGRLTTIRGRPCASVTDDGTTAAALNQSASWFAEDRSGEGFIVQLLEGDSAFVNWFTFDAAGAPAWYTGIASVAGQSVVIADLLATRGGRFGPDHDPAAVVRTPAGRLELYLGCSDGRVAYDMTNGLPSGFHGLTRLTTLAGLGCEEDSYTVPPIEALIGTWRSAGFGLYAAVNEATATIFEVTAVSCLPVIEAPTPGLAAGLVGVAINQDGSRLRLAGLDAVTPVFFDRAAAGLPAHCAGGGTGFGSDPVYNYDVFAATYRELYATFEVRGVDWSAREAAFAGRVTGSTPEDALFDTLSEMIDPLDDLHTTLESPAAFYSSALTPERLAYFQRAQGTEVDRILSSYLRTPFLNAGGGTLGYGITSEGIGFLEARSFQISAGGDSREDRLAFYDREIDRIFQFLANNSVDRLIVDVRRNQGGDSGFGFELARRFVRGQTRTAFSERRIDSGMLSAPYVAELAPDADPAFGGDIVVLTGRITGSAAEIFTLGMRALPHVTLVGENTAGILSRTGRTLPNGWTASMTIGQILTPEGEFFEASGIPPDFAVPVYADADLEAQRDPGLEQASALLTP